MIFKLCFIILNGFKICYPCLNNLIIKIKNIDYYNAINLATNISKTMFINKIPLKILHKDSKNFNI